MRQVIKTALAMSVLAGLAGCGLRGDLERPPPIFSEPPTEEAQKPVDSAAIFAVAEIDEDKVYYNSLGGEIPKPAPATEVEEDSMGEVSPG
jgi:predicted small lipoprotein YifL